VIVVTCLNNAKTQDDIMRGAYGIVYRIVAVESQA
jgi:hypothetical protein